MTRFNLVQTQLVETRAVVRAVHGDVAAAGSLDTRVMIVGEPDIAREVIANLIHRHSARRQGQLITLNPRGICDTALATELLAALSVRNATLFLDNVDDLACGLQDLLFAFLERNGRFGVGSNGRAPSHVRVITGTRRDLWSRVAGGTFREDLYYRLNVMLIGLPSGTSDACGGRS